MIHVLKKIPIINAHIIIIIFGVAVIKTQTRNTISKKIENEWWDTIDD
jgi:hypothetical protein